MNENRRESGLPGRDRKPELGGQVADSKEPSSKVFAGVRARGDALFEHHPAHPGLMPAAFMIGREARLSIAECLDLGRRGLPRRGAKICCSARLICLSRTDSPLRRRKRFRPAISREKEPGAAGRRCVSTTSTQSIRSRHRRSIENLLTHRLRRGRDVRLLRPSNGGSLNR